MMPVDTAQSAMRGFLADSEYIDWKHPLIMAKALELSEGVSGDEAVARRCFEFVRDAIKHSWDYRLNPITCKASDVLLHVTGFCYAKSHLLAALLRANRIPAGLCYQRLAVESEGPPYCLHGLNAVYLQQHGWYRIDARGNKPGVIAKFTPPVEQLAFVPGTGEEKDIPGMWAVPLPKIIQALTQFKTVALVAENLPDMEEAEMRAAVSWN